MRQKCANKYLRIMNAVLSFSLFFRSIPCSFRASKTAQKRFKSWLLPEKGQMHLFVSRFFRFSKKREKRRKKEKTGENRRFSAPDLLRPDALAPSVGLEPTTP